MPFIPDPSALSEITRNSDNIKGILPLPLSHSLFSFDSFGVASFFGGDNALTGAVTAITIPGHRWLGWYNLPGSIEIAKQFARLARMKLHDDLLSDGDHNPACLFNLDGMVGPTFIAADSGVVLDHTGHSATLMMRAVKATKLDPERGFYGENGELETGQSVTVVNLPNDPDPTEDEAQDNLESTPTPEARSMKVSLLPPPIGQPAAWSLFPVSVSMGACILCALVGDWFGFASIGVGMVAHGFACLVIGSGKIDFKCPAPAAVAPLAAGVLKGDRDIVILVGGGIKVNAITRGRFVLEYGIDEPQPPSNPKQSDIEPLLKHLKASPRHTLSPHPLLPYFIWISTLLLMAQPIIQLFLIPLATLFGQVVFIASILASWMYNTFLSYRVGHDDIQTQILFAMLGLKDDNIQKYRLRTWTSTITFTCFVLASVEKLNDPLPFLDMMLPNNTTVWKAWKSRMAEVLKDKKYVDGGKQLVFTRADLNSVEEKYKDLLQIFFDDAQDAWYAWNSVRNSHSMVALPREKKDEAKN